MRVLILVLSALKAPYDSLLSVQLETWDSVEHPKTRTLYYIGKDAPDGFPPGRIFRSAHYDEELEQISPRTLEAFEHSLTLPWDLMARTHSSTYVHKGNLVAFCKTLPRENLCCGLLTTGEQPFLWGGGSFIFSRDVVEKFVNNPKEWNTHVMEDNSITGAANCLGIPLDGRGRMCSLNEIPGGYHVMSYGLPNTFDFTDWADVKKANPHHYFRCKIDLRRDQDCLIMRKLKEHL